MRCEAKRIEAMIHMELHLRPHFRQVSLSLQNWRAFTERNLRPCMDEYHSIKNGKSARGGKSRMKRTTERRMRRKREMDKVTRIEETPLHRARPRGTDRDPAQTAACVKAWHLDSRHLILFRPSMLSQLALHIGSPVARCLHPCFKHRSWHSLQHQCGRDVGVSTTNLESWSRAWTHLFASSLNISSMR